MSKSPEAYASIALALVWISKCFTFSLNRKLQKHIFIEVNESCFKLFMTVFNLAFLFKGEFLSLFLLFQITYGAMTYWLRRWIPNPGVTCSKPLGDSKVDSAFDPSEIDEMSTSNFWEVSGKK